MTRCRKCNRQLKSKISIIRGIGPECLDKEIESSMPALSEEFDNPDTLLEAMEERTKMVQNINCPRCGYRCLKPIDWTHSSCIICKLNKVEYIYQI